MRAAVVNTTRPPLTIVQRVATAMRDEDLAGWRAVVEQYMIAIGARSTLCHISEERWEFHFLEGKDPPDAVLDELARFD